MVSQTEIKFGIVNRFLYIYWVLYKTILSQFVEPPPSLFQHVSPSVITIITIQNSLHLVLLRWSYEWSLNILNGDRRYEVTVLYSSYLSLPYILQLYWRNHFWLIIIINNIIISTIRLFMVYRSCYDGPWCFRISRIVERWLRKPNWTHWG
jgi:hypothetical protein